MFGLNRDSLLTPESFLGLVHPDDRSVAMAAMRADAPGGQTTRSGEFRIVHPNGLHWYLFTGGTELDQDGNPVRVSGIFRDITVHKKAEQEAEKLENDLQAMRRELARVSRQTTIGAMAASIAHEVNQPLSALVTNGSVGLRLLANAGSDLDE